jgi:hypothetical protein
MANSLTGAALGLSRRVEHLKRTPNWAGRQCAGFITGFLTFNGRSVDDS